MQMIGTENDDGRDFPVSLGLRTAAGKLGDALIAIAYHGLIGGNDPFYIPAADSMKFFKRAPKLPWWEFWSQNVEPPINVRIINAVYDPVQRKVDLDLEIMPYDLCTMTYEDSAFYSSVVLLTEDSLIADNYNDTVRIPDFQFDNVVRQVSGRCTGDVFPIGTETEVERFPIRRHVTMEIENPSWNPAKLRAKAYVTRTNRYDLLVATYLSGDQTPYLTNLVSPPKDSIWLLLPRGGEYLDPANGKLRIVWSSAGSVREAKIEATLDKGVSWFTIAERTTSTDSGWIIPDSLQGKKVRLRLTDPDRPQIIFLGKEFQFRLLIPDGLQVLSPYNDEQSVGGTDFPIEFKSTGDVSTLRTVSFGYDPYHFIRIGEVSASAGTVIWHVPDTSAKCVYLRIRSSDGVNGYLKTVSIVRRPPVLTKLYVYELPVPASFHNLIVWEIEGTSRNLLELSYSEDSLHWTLIEDNRPFSVRSTYWLSPDHYIPNVWLKLSSPGAKSAFFGPFPVNPGTSVRPLGENFGGSEVGAFAGLYPNPADRFVRLALPQQSGGSYRYLLIDALGRTAMSGEIRTEDTSAVPLDVGGVPSGSYILLLKPASGNNLRFPLMIRH